MAAVVVVADDPSPNFQTYEVNVPEPPLAVAENDTEIPTSVGFGLAVMPTTSCGDGLMVSVVDCEAEVTAIESVAFTFTVKDCAVALVMT